MKKIKFQKKLSLNKEIIATLNDDQMNQVKGGTGSRSYHYCLVNQPAFPMRVK
jgi:natural product precursor